MKKYMFMAALAAVTVSLFTSCSEEDLVKTSAKTGDPIFFSATTRPVATRTVYSDDKASNGKWDLYWVNNDEVTIHCPQASTADGHETTATYTVTAPSANSTTYGVSGEGLYWGGDEVHQFYEAYPSKNITSISDAGVVTAYMPETQTAKLVHGYYVDMDAALMAGKSAVYNKSSLPADGIVLPFDPIFTAVEITIKASADQDYLLKNITLSNISDNVDEDQILPLAGDFTYNIGTQEYTTVGEKKKLVYLEFGDGVLIPQQGNNDEPDSLKAIVFVRGDFNNAVKVLLNGEADGKLDIKIKEPASQNDNNRLKARARNHISLGQLPPKPRQEVDPDDPTPPSDLLGSNWIAFERNATYVSRMSIPGSYDSGAFVKGNATKDYELTQSDTIAGSVTSGSEVVQYQLNHGVRAFDMRLKWDGTAGFYINQSYSSTSGNVTLLRNFLGYAVDWLKAHTTEFLVVFLRTSENNHNSFRNNINREITQQIMGGSNSGYFLTSFKSDITVQEARGKVLFVFVNETPSSTFSIIGNSVNGWSTTTSGLQTLSFSNPGVGSGNAIIHDQYICTTANKKTYIANAFNNCKSDADISRWHITCPCYHTGAQVAVANEVKEMNEYVITEVGKCTSYQQPVGIVLMGYVCTGELHAGQKAVNEVWSLNFKSSGSSLVPKY